MLKWIAWIGVGALLVALLFLWWGERRFASDSDPIDQPNPPGELIAPRHVARALEACTGERLRDTSGTHPRLVCRHDEVQPTFEIELVGDEAEGYRSAVLTVGPRGLDAKDTVDQLVFGAQFFNLIARNEASSFMPEDWKSKKLVSEEFTAVFEGRRYVTRPIYGDGPEDAFMQWSVEVLGLENE